MIDFVIIVLSLEEEKWKNEQVLLRDTRNCGQEENQQFFYENKCIMDKGFLYINSLINNTAGVFIEVL